MKNITASNFRKIKDKWDLDLAPITFFTGTNNSGKSSVLKSLLLLSDYGASKNHFQLSFSGENHRSHKIDCYSNAVNWHNQREGDWQSYFSFSNNGYSVKIAYNKPALSAHPTKVAIAELSELVFTRENDGATFKMSNKGQGAFQLNIEDRFLEIIDKEKTYEEQEKLLDIQEKLLDKIEEFKEQYILLKDNSPQKISLNQEIKKLSQNYTSVKKKVEEIRLNPLKVYKGTIFQPEFNIEEFAGFELTIDRIVRSVLMKYFQTAEKAIGKSSISNEKVRLMRIADSLMNALNFSVDHLSPHRNSQSRLYINDEYANDINNIINKHSIYPIKKKSKAGVFLKEWMKKFDIGDDFRIRTIEGMASIVEIKEDGGWLNMVDKGFGAGQIFTILLSIALKVDDRESSRDILSRPRYMMGYEKESILIIEEPEANLHPALQSKLADLFNYTYTNFGIRFIIETHSEYILRRSQLIVKSLYKEDANAVNPFGVYYFDKDKGPYPMDYRQDGVFKENFGPGFFDIASQHALELIKRSN